MADAIYQAGLVSHGADVPYYKTKAEALKAARDAARAQPGRLSKFYARTTKRGSVGFFVEERYFRANEAGKVTEEE